MSNISMPFLTYTSFLQKACSLGSFLSADTMHGNVYEHPDIKIWIQNQKHFVDSKGKLNIAATDMN